MIQVPCCSPLLEAKDGVEPSFQDLQSDTFPLCYLAKPATSCAKVKRLFFLPRSLFFYICGGGLPEPEKRGQLLSPLPCSIFLFWLKVASHSTTVLVQRPDRRLLLLYVCSGEEHLEASSCKQPCLSNNNLIFLTKKGVLLKVSKQPVPSDMAFHYSFPEKVARPARRIHCLCGSAMQLKNGNPFLLVRL